MRIGTLLLSLLLAAAVSTTADAAKKKHHRTVAAPAVVNVDATDAQRARFFQDSMNPMSAKW